jgi:uncharacterized protein (UPF0332 family)
MNASDLQALVDHRLQKSEDALKAAKIMMDQQMYGFAMNRVYYSVYYAVQALLARQGVSFGKHGQVKGYFNREYIKSGKLPKEIGRFYNKAFEYRQKYDYVDFTSPDASMVSEYLDTATQILRHIRAYLKKMP